jgi:FixJ family two-component response regulator
VNPTNQESKTNPIRVLLVEDDEDYREIVGSELSWHGFAVRSFADGASLLGSLDTAAEADVIILDWRLPNISGIDLLPQLRERGVNLPVVFLTSHLQPANEKLAFERGALDFIDKTRGVEVLASRLRLLSEPGRPAGNPGSAPSHASVSLRSLTRSEWDAVASQFSDLSYPQCGSFAEVAARDMGASQEFIAIYEGPALIGLAAIRLKRIPLSPIGVAYVSRGPMISLRG